MCYLMGAGQKSNVMTDKTRKGTAMKSNLAFYSYGTKEASDCGQVLDIEFSNHDLNWEGVILEKGSSPYFYPKNVYTPYFYFALALDKELNWNVEKGGNVTSIRTLTDDTWINPPQTPFTHNISDPCHFVILAIEKQVFLDSCPLNLTNIDLQFLNNYNVSDASIKGIIDLFVLEVKNKGKNGAAYLKSLIALLSNHYIQHYSNYQDQVNSKLNDSKFDQSQVDKIDDYINNNISHSISVDDLAERLHCSKFYFLREFKKRVGITPYQYLMNKRIEQAKLKLSGDNANISLISHELGFNDQSHFTRAFKAHYGVTPGHFLKQLKS